MFVPPLAVLKNLLGRGLAFGLGELDDLVLARLLLLGRRRNTLDETDDAATHVRVLNPPECRYQREPVRRREAVGHVCRRRRFAGRLRAFSLRLRVELDRSAVEEERHRHLQDQRYLLYARRTDAIGALLVFLDLLEGQTECLGKLFLRHRKHHPPHADLRSDVFVDRIRRFLFRRAGFRFRLRFRRLLLFRHGGVTSCWNKKRLTEPVSESSDLSYHSTLYCKKQYPWFCTGLEPSTDAAHGFNAVVEPIFGGEWHVLRMQIRFSEAAEALLEERKAREPL